MRSHDYTVVDVCYFHVPIAVIRLSDTRLDSVDELIIHKLVIIKCNIYVPVA